MTSVHQSSKQTQAILAIRAHALEQISSIQSQAIQEIREIEHRAIQAIRALEKKARSRKAYQARKAREAFLKRQARREQKAAELNAHSVSALPMQSFQTVETKAVPQLTLSLYQPSSDDDEEPNYDEYLDYSPPWARSESNYPPWYR